MNEKEAVAIFSNLGWCCGKDEVGDRFCIFDMEDRFVHIMPTIGSRADHYRVSMMPSVSTREFTSAVEEIYGEEIGFCPIITSNIRPEKIVSVTSEYIIKISNEIKEWAVSQNIEDGLKAYRDLPTDAKGARPLRHLAALALNHDVRRLTEYKDNFSNGDRLDFVPYITSEMIGRALELTKRE